MDKLTTKQERELRRKEKMDREIQEKKKQQLQSFAIWGAVALVLIASVFIVFKASQNSKPNPAAGGAELSPVQNLAPVTDKDMTRGPKDAKVTLIEYADFQCPACRYYHPVVNQLYDTYKNKVRFVYRFFPLANLHQHAMVSAEAAYAASLQGKFWEMGDLLFNNQDEWATASNYQQLFDRYAKQLGLDVARFDADMAAPSTLDAINASEDTGIKIGVTGTPTFIINGQQIVNNPQDFAAFKQIVDQELQKSGK